MVDEQHFITVEKSGFCNSSWLLTLKQTPLKYNKGATALAVLSKRSRKTNRLDERINFMHNIQE